MSFTIGVIRGRARFEPVLCFLLALPAAHFRGQGMVHDSADPAGRWRDASTEDYRMHLIALRTLTQACAQARDVKKCDPTLVGPDDRIALTTANGEDRRVVRYGWLRVLLYKAEEPDKADQAAKERREQSQKRKTGSEESPRPEPRTTSQLLQDADARLQHDLAEAGGPPGSPNAHAGEHDALRKVLTGREFRNLQQVPENDTVMERVGSWLNHLFAGLVKLRAKSAWIGRALIWAFFLAVAALLGWRVMRTERRWRRRVSATPPSTARDAVSARDWQLWLADARRAAADGRWRDAIHFTYWASISCLESRRVWPADRARTPREYLALMAPEDPRTPGLASLTRSFEHSWYGGWQASEGEYRQAERTAASLTGGNDPAEGQAS